MKFRPQLRRLPVTVGLLVVLVAVNALAGTAVHGPDGRLRAQFGLGAEQLIMGHDLGTLVTSVPLADGPVGVTVTLLAVLLVVGRTERLIGHGRTLLVYGLTALGGGLLGTALQAAGLLTRGVWSTPPADLMVFHPFTPIVGTAMAASAFAGPLWRRRVRVLGFAGLIVVLLYSGQPGDLYQLAGAVVGMLLGGLLTRHRPRLRWPRSSHHEIRTLLALLVGIGAVGPLVALLQRTGYGMLRPLGRLFGDPLPRPDQVHRACLSVHAAMCDRAQMLGRLNSPGTVLLDVLPLIVLLIAAVGIWNGRRTAAWTAIVVNVVLGLLAAFYYNVLPILQNPAQLDSPDGPESLTLQTLLAVLLPWLIAAAVVGNLRHLPVRARPAVTWAAVAAVAAVVGCGLVGYLTVGLLGRGAFVPHVAFPDLVEGALERFVPVGFLRPGLVEFAPVTAPAWLLTHWMGPLAWLTLATGSAAGSILVARPRSAVEQRRVRQLLQVGSAGSISYMTTWPGNRYWFSDDGRHAIAYRESSGVAVTLGEPIGAVEGAIEAARAFVIACDDRAITPAFYAVRPQFAAALGTEVGWSSTGIGADTLLHPGSFSMRGKRWQDVRSSINRADRLGVRAVWTEWSALGTAAKAQLEAISEEWIAEHRLPELGFTLGGLRELRDPDVQLMLAVGPGDRIEAVTSWLPTWHDGTLIGLTLDFMRRQTRSMNGVMEFLIASVVLHARQLELAFVSLSVAPLSVGPSSDPDPIRPLLQLLARVLEPVYGFASLATFKAKFEPDHVPVVLAYPDAVSLPAISLALTRAYLPELRISELARLARAVRVDQRAPVPRGLPPA